MHAARDTRQTLVVALIGAQALNHPTEALVLGSSGGVLEQQHVGLLFNHFALQLAVLSPRFQHQPPAPAVRLQAVVGTKSERILDRIIRSAAVAVLQE